MIKNQRKIIPVIAAGPAVAALSLAACGGSSGNSSGASSSYYKAGYNFVNQVAAGGGDTDELFGSPGETASDFCTSMQLALEPPEQGANVLQTNDGTTAHAGLPPPSSQDPNWQQDTTNWINGCEASFNANSGGG